MSGGEINLSPCQELKEVFVMAVFTKWKGIFKSQQTFLDSIKLYFGTDEDAYVDFDGSNFRAYPLTDTSGNIAAGKIASSVVTKAMLNSEVYTIEHIILTGNTNDFDNETVKLTKLWSAGTIVRVVYFTNAALGTSLGIDIVDGATDGSGTDVIDSCADNLNGSDVNSLTTPYALSAGDYINVTFDDVTDDVSFTIDI